MDRKFALTCCSTVDLSREQLARRDITWVPFHFEMNGVEYPDDLGQSMPFPVFYAQMEKAMPVTSQVNVEEFECLFEPLLAAGHDVLHLSLSSGLSGSCNSARLARENLLAKYPRRKLLVVDTLGASSGYGLLVDTVADLRDAGLSIEQAAARAEEERLFVHHWFFSTDLTSFKRGGRISGAEAMVGTMLGICPLMNMDDEGHLVPRKKIRSKQKTMDEMVRMMEAHAQNGTAYDGRCYISNSACEEDARTVAAMIEERFPALKGKILINSIGTVIGAHTGPGTVALFFMGDRRTGPDARE